ncbi:hypothetical protein GOQ27_00825 [Clostridium sp. D2Q-11]|uniref:DUF5668 domain-containing protein n=1 Tax=Anaeromonas frigoriresistens TaxID=2683708 RepID=A0A942UWN9_9FIRM|nr:hypothetical protein [Anaeromonas frigoriresistens]MBS4536982.1 hypothetical protein [Anaeromonas frigoriresistens]
MNKNNYIFGIGLVLLGIILLITNISFIPNDIIMVLLGIILLGVYYKRKSSLTLIIGVILIAIGLKDIIDLYTDYEISSLIFNTVIGAIFLIVYFRNNKGWAIYPGIIIPAMGIHDFLESNVLGDKEWLFLLILSIALYIIYFIQKKRYQIKWTFNVATILLVISGISYINTDYRLDIKIWKMIAYLWPVLLILIGVKILYNNYKEKKKD